MPSHILLKAGSQRWQRAAEKELPDEATLQKLIRDNPETLPFEDLGDDIPPLLVVGREISLANGYADVIGVDQEGLITVIECKLDRNPEIKRKVIGQILGYGAYLWEMTYEDFESNFVRKYFDSPECHRSDLKGMTLEEAMVRFHNEQFPDTEWDREGFRKNLAENLLNGHLRLVIVVDKVNDELRRTIEFLNQSSAKFEILCAELRYFATGETELLVPTLIGVPPTRKTAYGQKASVWDEVRFFGEISKTLGEKTENLGRKLLNWAKGVFEIDWGSGAVNGAFIPYISWPDDRFAVPFTVWTSGNIEINFDYLKRYKVFESEDRRKALLAKLNEIETIQLAVDSFNRRPSFKLTALANNRDFEQFTNIMSSVASDLIGSRDVSKSKP